MRSGPVCNSHRVTHYTLCRLGEPEIAIGHEPRIEPWLTLNTSLACRSFELDGIATLRGGNFMSMGNRPSFSREAELQWAGSRERNLVSGRGGAFFLTSLFIELIDRGCECKRRLTTG